MPNLPNECIAEQVNLMTVDDSELTVDGTSNELSPHYIVCVVIMECYLLFIIYYIR